MTVRKSAGRKRRLCCDHPKCGAQFGPSFDRDRIGQIVNAARQNGWRARQDSLGIWRHDCPAHAEEPGRASRFMRHPIPKAEPMSRYRADLDG